MSRSSRLLQAKISSYMLLAAMIASLGVLAGCQPAQSAIVPTDDVPVVTSTSTAMATATPTRTATATVTSTPTQTPTSTPTPLPAEQLSQAMRHQHNGLYGLAIAAFQSVSENAAASSFHAESLYRLGQTQLMAGDFAEAEAALLDFLDRFPDHEHASHALALLATAQEKLGKLESAAESLERYVKDHPEVQSYIQKWLGDLYYAMEDGERAAIAYEKAADSAPRLSLSVYYREQIAEALKMQEDFTGAIQQYDRILDVAQITKYRGKIQYLAGMAYLKIEQPRAAASRFRKAIAEEQRVSYAHAALVQLLNLDEVVDEFLRGMVDYYNDAYWPAIAAFQRRLEADPDDRPDAAHYYMGASYEALGLLAEANEEFQLLVTDYPQSDLMGEAWRGQARLAARAGDVEGSRELYDKFAADYPAHPLAPHALLSRARLAEDAGHLGQAIEEYLALAEAYPDHVDSGTALHRAGLGLYRLGDYWAAAQAWESLMETTGAGDLVDEARFWAGKSRMVYGDVDQAAEHLRQVIEDHPLDYYGQRGAALMRAIGEEPPADTISPPETAEQWLADWSGVSLDEIRRTIPSELKSHPTLIRAHELMEIGLIDEADDELDGLRADFESQPAHLYYLSQEFQRWGVSRQSILGAARVIALSGSPLMEVPVFLRQLAYPTYFDDLVEAEASERAVDPLLVYSVIRQESLFQSHVSSWASARGLMQVIPPTGEWIAMRLGWSDFSSADLYLPYVSVKFGTYYLQQQLLAFDGDVVSALAAYNAGPGNAARWREIAGQNDPDLIYALVDVEETQRYLERILQNRAVYYLTYP